MQKTFNPLDSFQKQNFEYGGKKNSNKLKIFFNLIIVIAILVIVFFILNNEGAFIFLNKSANTFSVQKNVIDQADDDGDGLLNSEEKIYGTNPKQSDSDGDTFNDYEEIQNGYNPLGDGKIDKTQLSLENNENYNSTNNDDYIKIPKKKLFVKKYDNMRERLADPDFDELNNAKESIYGLDPNQADTDKDGVDDGTEIKNYTNPLGRGKMTKILVGVIDKYEDFYTLVSDCSKSVQRGDDSLMDDCIISQAVYNNDESLCAKTKGGEYDDRDDCYEALAIINNDESLCEKIPSNLENGTKLSKNTCFTKIAQNKKDLNICDKILFYDEESSTYRYEKYECQIQVVKETGKKEVCDTMLEKMNNDFSSLLHKNSGGMNLVIGGPSDEKEKLRDNCLINLAGFHGDASMCNFKDESDNQDCYEEVAQKNASMELCNKTKYLWAKKNCFLQLALQKKDTNLCKNLLEKKDQENCITEIAKKTRYLADCHALKEQTKIDFCQLEVVRTAPDKNMCVSIKNRQFHDYCIDIFKKTANDQKICEEYYEETNKKACYAMFAEKN
jgi:hypothetical protein